MRHIDIEKRVYKIIAPYLNDSGIDNETPITSEVYKLDSRALAAIFILISEEFEIDLNDFFDIEQNNTLTSISEAIIVVQSK